MERGPEVLISGTGGEVARGFGLLLRATFTYRGAFIGELRVGKKGVRADAHA